MFDKVGSGTVIEADAATRLMRRAVADDSVLTARLCDAEAVILVLDDSGERILHASRAADGLRRAVSEPDGRLVPALRIGAQIDRARPRRGTPLLLRLHLDPRRLASPALVTIVRAPIEAGTEEGGDVLIVLAATPLPRLRSRLPARPDLAAPEPAIPAEPDSPLPQDPEIHRDPELSQDPESEPRRFTWRSDADGTVSDLSRRPGDRLRERMFGRTWRSLAASETLLDADGLLVALDQGRTFRSIPVILLAADGTRLELDLSGAPLDRTGRGFRGFGQIRAIAKPEADMQVAPPVPSPSADKPAEEPEAPRIRAEAAAEPSPAASDPILSSHEHAAFREIARALGARFAGDDALSAPPERGLPCAVMPFPTSAARSGDAAPIPDAAMVATLERLPAGVLVYRENAVLFANRRLLDLTGYADAATLDAAGGIARLFGGLQPHARTENETPLVLTGRDGTRLGVLIEHSVLDWAGQPAELLLARDAEPSETLRASTAEAMAQDFAGRRGADALAVLDTLEDGIATLDQQARILTLNRSAAAVFGLDPREVVGSSFLSLFAPENAVDLLARLHAEACAAPAQPASVRARASGTPLRVRIHPMAGDGQARLCAVIDSPPPVVRSDAQALSLPEMLAQVRQEIRTPVHGILAAADLMLGDAKAPLDAEHHRESLHEIRTGANQILDFVDGLSDLVRIEAGRLDLTVAPIPLNEVVARCVALLQPQAARERIVLRTSFSADLEVLMADERSVSRAALNVIANAIAFTAAGGQVIVSTTMADRGEIALRVRDTGIGMTADEVEVALQPFRRVGPEKARADAPIRAAQKRGTGLGLPLSKALVEANRGRLRIDSRKDEGTLVEMLFPVDAATKRA